MDVPTVVEAIVSDGVTTRVQPWRVGLTNNAGDVVKKGEVHNPWDETGFTDACECGRIKKLGADVSAVALNATKKQCSGKDACAGPTCVGTLDRTGFKAFVRDVIDHVDKVCHGGHLPLGHEVVREVVKTLEDIFDDGKACGIDAEFFVMAQGLA